MASTAESSIRLPPSVTGHGSPSLLLTGGWVALDASTSVRADLEIVGGRVFRMIKQDGNGMHQRAAKPNGRSAEISVEGCMILPGLINSHDHLEFNLFPQLGRGPYPNLGEWADDIFHPERSPVREHLSIPKQVRLRWGGLKNLLSGVTTVCHHNWYEENIFEIDFPVRVVKRYGWAHSLRFGKNVREAFLSTPPGAPFIIHLGEGLDRQSGNEIFDLDRLGGLDFRTVIVHGVGLTALGHALRRRRDAAMVWCPTSNRFTLGTTLDPTSLDECDRVSLGSDSALTAEGDLLDEIRAAHREGMDPRRIYSMVTNAGADILRLCGGEGEVRPGSTADMIVVRWENSAPAQTLIRTRLESIEMVLVSGKPHLLSAKTALCCPPDLLDGFEDIEVEGTSCFVRAPVRRLLTDSRACLGPDVRLAGKRVSV